MYDWYNGASADYALITEIDATNGFAEITNPSAKMIDLSGWRLAAGAGQWTLPAQTTLAAGKSLVIARDAATLRAKFGITALEIPQFFLNPNSDTLRLNKGAITVDLAAWGTARPGWTLKAPLCRPVAGKDTNTSLDWTRATRPSPGAAGCGQ